MDSTGKSRKNQENDRLARSRLKLWLEDNVLAM
jgi:hypothetical protein